MHQIPARCSNKNYQFQTLKPCFHFCHLKPGLHGAVRNTKKTSPEDKSQTHRTLGGRVAISQSRTVTDSLPATLINIREGISAFPYSSPSTISTCFAEGGESHQFCLSFPFSSQLQRLVFPCCSYQFPGTTLLRWKDLPYCFSLGTFLTVKFPCSSL